MLEPISALPPETVTKVFAELHNKMAQKLANTDAQDIPDKLSECTSDIMEVIEKLFLSKYQEMISLIKPRIESALKENIEKISAQESLALQDTSQSKLASLFNSTQEKISLSFALARSFYQSIMKKGGEQFLQAEIQGIKEGWIKKLHTCGDRNQCTQETQSMIEAALAKNKLTNAHQKSCGALPDCVSSTKKSDLFTAYRPTKRRRDSSDSDRSNDEFKKIKRFAPQ